MLQLLERGIAMLETIYKKLSEHLNNLPGGFPPTDSGVEIRILKQLFTEDEAEFALHLTLLPEEPRVVARRAKISVPILLEKICCLTIFPQFSLYSYYDKEYLILMVP